MKKGKKNKRKKFKIVKILCAICLSIIFVGLFIGTNTSEKTSIISEIKDKKIFAADIVTDTTWGGCKWKIDGNGKLFIYASSANGNYAAGEIPNIGSITSAPWYNYRTQIKTAQVGQSGSPVKVKEAADSRIGGMFNGCTNLTTVDFVNFDTTKATHMWYMFQKCSSLTTINGFDRIKADNTKEMAAMFYGCSSLQSLTLGSSFNSSKVTDMMYMFRDCSALKNIYGFENLKTSSVTDMNCMFFGCYALENLTFGTNFNTSNVTNMNYMFYNCDSMTEFNFGTYFNTSNVTTMRYMFCNCDKVTELDLSKFDMRKVTTTESMLFGTHIRVLNIKGNNFVSNSITNMKQMFPGGLQELTVGNFNFNMSSIGDGGVSPYPFGRGSWEKFSTSGVSQGIVSAVQVAIDSSSTDITGTYKKVSNVTNLFNIDETVDYTIDKYIDVDGMTCVTSSFSNGVHAGIVRRDFNNTNPINSKMFVYIDNIPTTNSIYEFNQNEYIKVKIPNAAMDRYENRYDLEMKLTNVRIDGLSSASGLSEVSVFPLRFYSNSIITCSNLFAPDSYDNENPPAASITNHETSWDITMTILKSDGTPAQGKFMFSGYDLDIPDIINGTENLTYNSQFAEGINLGNGIDTSNIYKANTSIGSWLVQSNEANNVVRLRGSNVDNSTEMSEFMVPASATGSTITWTSGALCETTILSTYQPKLVKIKKMDYNFGSEVEGATLKLMKGNEVIDEWETDSTEHSYFLNPGQYTLSEVLPPPGYNYAGDIVFWVDSENKLTRADGEEVEDDTIIMYDDLILLNYTVEYYYDNVLDSDKTEYSLTPYGFPVDSYIDKCITGYEFDHTENFPLYFFGGNPTIKVYYKKANFEYNVEYYYDGVKDNSKTETSSAEYQSTINTYIDKNIEGYKLDEVVGLPLTITENPENNVIKVYYVKDSFGYSIEYYYDNVKDNTKTETGTAVYQSTISTYNDKNITGYKFDKTENLPLTISATPANNVIKVYYVKDNFGYTVEYYYDNVKDNTKTETGSAVYQSTISTYTDKNITGYKFDKTENLPLTISTNPSNNVIKVYYVKDSFGYTIEYYYDNVKDNSKTATGTAVYQSTIDSYTDKNITGYKFDKTENLPLTISATPADNVIKIYYVKDNFGYTVEYYYDNVKDSSKTVTSSALYQSVIDSYTDKNITGYKLDRTENLPLTISATEAYNVIKVYYIKDNFGYTVEYYYDNVKDNTKTETGTAVYQSTISTYTDKNKTGYKLDTIENLPLTISATPANNVIKIYYVKDSFGYTVEYYYDNVKDNTKTETGTAVYQSVINNYVGKSKTGYKFDKTENLPLTISATEADNVIKVYYIKDNFGYTVEYYYDNVKDNTKTETGSAVYQSTISTYTDKKITGYKFDKTENLPLTISATPANNVIKVYYIKDSFNYSVEYYYDNVKDNTKTETGSAVYQSIIDSYTDKNITGYKFDKTENLPLTISATPADNVIKVYYVKDNFEYTVEYYYDNVKDSTKTETGTATYQSTISTYTDKNITGYKLDTTENLPLTISETPANNVIKIYYVKDSFGYTIEYYYDNVKDDTKTDTGTATYQSTINIYTDKNITGYKFDKTENLPLTISATPADNVIKVYYVKDSFGYTVEYYYDNVKDDSKTVTGIAEYQSVINNYVGKNITGYRFDKTENFPLTITENPDNNVIKVYYILDDGNTKTLSYTVEYYKDNVKVDGDTQTRTKTVQILDPDTLEIDRSLISNNNKYVGYKIDRTDPANVPDIVTNGDVIKVYYIKDSFAYTIEYYYDNVKDDSKTESSSAEYQSQITSYTNKNITGYKFDKTENLPLTISENPDNNIIKVYYVKEKFAYSVEYYYDNTRDDSKTETRLEEYQTIINNYIDKNITGYKFDRTENLPLTISENQNNNIIRVYYVKDSFNYTVEYYYNNVKDDTKTETKSAEYQSLIDVYEDKKPDGFEFDKTENLPLTITENAANNVIKVYYYPIRTLTVNHIDINTNEVLGTEESKGREGNTITTAAKDFTGYTLVRKPNVETYTLTEQPQIVEYFYAKVSSGVVEKHINIATDQYIAEDRTYEGYVGKDYTTESKNVTDYELVTNEKYYKTMAEKNPNLLSENSVTTVEELLQKLQLNAGDSYIPENHEGQMTETLIEVKYYYWKKSKVVIKYLDKNSNKPIHPDTSIEGHEEDPYTTTPLTIEGYDLITTPDYYPPKLDGEMGSEPTTIVFYYEKKTSVEINHICIVDDSIISSSKIDGHEKDPYSSQILDKNEYKNYRVINNKEYYEYASNKDKNLLSRNNVTTVDALLKKLGLVETNPYIPANSKGEMAAEKITVNYYYMKQATIIIKHYDEETGEEIGEPEIELKDVGNQYSTGSIAVAGYEVDKEKIPENAQGIITEEGIEVIYYYKKAADVDLDTANSGSKDEKANSPKTGDTALAIASGMILALVALNLIQKAKMNKKGTKTTSIIK